MRLTARLMLLSRRERLKKKSRTKLTCNPSSCDYKFVSANKSQKLRWVCHYIGHRLPADGECIFNGCQKAIPTEDDMLVHAIHHQNCGNGEKHGGIANNDDGSFCRAPYHTINGSKASKAHQVKVALHQADDHWAGPVECGLTTCKKKTEVFNTR